MDVEEVIRQLRGLSEEDRGAVHANICLAV